MQRSTQSAKPNQASKLDSPIGGLSFMICFTILWTQIAAYWIKGQDYFVTTIILLAAIIWLTKRYVDYSKRKKEFPETATQRTKSDKWFTYIFVAEGVAILVSRNVLINLGLAQYVLASFILIVGLHFYPLGIIFKRTFDYFTATALSAVAIVGIIELYMSKLPDDLINFGMATFCALTTIAYGTRMIITCGKIVSQNSNKTHSL
jgi:hypothetical protein